MSLKKGELVDFEAHLVGRSRNGAKPRVKRGRKSTLTADRMEKLLGCVRRRLSNKHACMVAGISETTFYRWIEKGKHAKRGPYREFWDSLQAAHAHLALLHGPEQIADLPVPVAESPGAVRIGHPGTLSIGLRI